MSGSASRRERAAKAKQERAQERLARRLEKEDIVLAFDYDPRALGYHGPVINLPLHGVGVDTTGKAYMGRILFTTKSKFAEAMHHMYVDTQVMGATLESDLIDGLIGRDVLMHFQLTYDGRTGAVRMKYYRPVK